MIVLGNVGGAEERHGRRRATQDATEDDKSGAANAAPSPSKKGQRGLRWALGIALAMWACGFFVARVPGATRPEMSGASAFFVVAFALPSYVALWRWAGRAAALRVLGALSAFAIGIEALAVATGWPYGHFSYGDAIGAKVAGLVPWTVPFAWAPLVLGTHALAPRALRLLPRWSRAGAWAQVLAGTLALAAADLVLDPGAVLQKFWAYDQGGLYYGVPASNYFGWLLSGAVGHAAMLALLHPAISRSRPNRMPAALPPALPPTGLAVSLGWTLAFWASVCAWSSLWIPAAVGHAYLLALWLLLRLDAPASAPQTAESR